MGIVRTYLHLAATLLLTAGLLTVAGCRDEFLPEVPAEVRAARVVPETRGEDSESRHVVILYSAGFNTLSGSLVEDINELSEGYLPRTRRYDNVLLVFSHRTKVYGQWSNACEPVLMRLYRDDNGKNVRDTLLVFPPTTRSGDPQTLKEVLTYVKENYPGGSYGLVISSHASGWVPVGYYRNPYVFEGPESFWDRQRFRRLALEAQPSGLERAPGKPQVKSICQDIVGGQYHEMDLTEFAAAIPMKMEYILLDCCLMGCVETAWALRDVCHLLGFSPTEVLSDGYDYSQMGRQLLSSTKPDPEAVCRSFFEQYDSRSGDFRSATVTLTDLSRIDSLARVCRRLTEKYRSALAGVNPGAVQRYYTHDRHYFYDLEDIYRQAGIERADSTDLADALAWCTRYKAATDHFLSQSDVPTYDGFPINTYSGFSMYLPAHGSAFLNNYYKTLAWNEVTGLVE